MTPTTDADVRRWQRRAVRVLGELLQREGLPVLRWTVATGARLVGHVDEHDLVKGRQQFEAWAQTLDGAKRYEVEHSGRVHLNATVEHLDGLVAVGVIADLVADPEAER
jgi:hypothetical protein